MKIKYYGIVVLALLVTVVVVWGIVQFTNKTKSAEEVSVITFSASDHIKGNPEARVVLIEYSDFQCPACGAYYPVVEEIVNEFGKDIVFVYRHFPLQQIHAHAQLASRATEASEKQGKFWEMHALLFEKQKEWSGQKNAQDLFVQYAESIGLNSEQFKVDIESKEVDNKVENDFEGGLSHRVDATPTFFLNGIKIQNPRSYEEFRVLIQEALIK